MQIRRIINSVFSSNTYVLTNAGEKAYVIDVGDVMPIKALLDKEQKRVGAIFLTHTHFDHIYGLPDLMKCYPDCVIYTSEFGKMALMSDKLNFSRYHGKRIIWEGQNVSILHEGDKVEIFNGVMPIEVMETPGHDESCLSYKIGNHLFSGDSYIPGVKVIASFPRSNKEEALKSEKRIMVLAATCNLYPGHGDMSEMPCTEYH